MREAIAESRPELSQYAPRMYRIQIPQKKIGTVIGPGGRVIRSIVEETKCTIDVEEDGTVLIGSTSEEAANRAIEIIQGLTKEAEVGAIYNGKVTRITNFGAFVEIMPGKEGLVRISELADYRVPSVEDVVQIGDEIMVMVIEIDNMGRINLSRRSVLEGTMPEERGDQERAPVPGTAHPRGRGGPPRRRGDGRPPGGQPRGPEGGGQRPRRPYGQRRSEPRQEGPGGPPKPPFGRRW
jgi:polyribonucleotide nucleotidyltransferase